MRLIDDWPALRAVGSNVGGAVVTIPDSRPNPAAPAEPASIEQLRARIDALDGQIAHLLQERAEVSLRVGQTKGGCDSAPISVPHREADAMSTAQRAHGPLDQQPLAT